MARSCTQKSKKNRRMAISEKKKLNRLGRRPLDRVKSEGNDGLKYLENLPSDGKYTCNKCDVFFRDENTLFVHYRTKGHKRRLKEWEEKTHDAKDAEIAAGLY